MAFPVKVLEHISPILRICQDDTGLVGGVGGVGPPKPKILTEA